MNEKQMMHGEDWTGQDLTGWILSEKMNGCRAYWDGKTLWSRGGIAAQIPASWADELPDVALDCELYDGIDGVYKCGSALKYGHFTPTMRLVVFDAPGAPGGWDARMHLAMTVTRRSLIAVASDFISCDGNNHAIELLQKVQAKWRRRSDCQEAGACLQAGPHE